MYRTDLINAAMGSQRLTNPKLAEIAGVGIGTVSSVRNGDEGVTLPTLRKIADALGLSMQELFTPKAEQVQEEEPAAA